MLNLEGSITLDRAAIQSPNLTDQLSERDLLSLGQWVWDGYQQDLRSRSPWERRMESAMDLAMQVQKAKNFPWPNASNIAFPLVTIAALQLHARAYPAIIQAPHVVKMRVVGEDPTGARKARALRVANHMSWQVLEQDEAWEEGQDRLLIVLPIVGCAFKKSRHDPALGHNVSELVMPRDLVLNYWAKSVETCPRKTHVIPMHRNDIRERMVRGTFKDVSESPWFQGVAPQPTKRPEDARVDNRKGNEPPPQSDETTPFVILEQHCLIDLDQDGYAEPYIITIEESSKTVLRIVTRFDRESDIERTTNGKILCIRAIEYFTKYELIPSPDGGVYGLGFGILLGPLNESVNTLVNQLVDAGTMANTAGGFLGRGAKIRGGVYTFAPLEWKRVDSTADDLHKSIFPLPVREPSSVLFQLLVLLVNYANRIPGTTEMMVGENPGQNTPAETSRTMIEQGMKIYSDIFKRIWRSMKGEFRKLYVLNGIHLADQTIYGESGQIARREDYLDDPRGIVPVADPNITSDSMELLQAQALKQSSMTTPGYDLQEVEHRWLRALRVDGIDQVYPGPDKVKPLSNPKITIEQIKLQGKQLELQHDRAKFAAELMEEQRLNNAKILELESKAALAIAQAQGESRNATIAAFNAAIGALKAHDESLRSRIELVLKGLEVQQKGSETSDGSGNKPGGMGQLAGAPGNTGTPQAGGLENSGLAGSMV